LPFRITALSALFFLLLAASSSANPAVTIIIDDLGHTLGPGRRAVALPGPVVMAFLPRTPRARQLAELANASGKEVLLHLPLQPVDARDGGPGSLLLDMTQRRFRHTLHENIDSVPHAIGVNGHQGSLLTRHPGHMQWLMDEIGSRGLIFVDSYTTHLSVALQVAREVGVTSTRRDVFLDNDPRRDAIEREFQRLLRLAEERGSAVAIGHPYPETLAFLEAELPTLPERGFRLVGIRDLLYAKGGRRAPGSQAAGGSARRAAP
jgi:polysaccharide deacetylase 2 family uncharacterized protein YibQ